MPKRNRTKFFSVRKQVGIGRKHGVSEKGGVGFFRKGTYRRPKAKRKY